MEKVCFDIVIPLYNRATLVGETLQSLLDQSYPHWCAYVIDDGSIDGSMAVAQNFAAISDGRIIVRERPNGHLSGGSGARNYGASLGSSSWLIFLDSDDLFTPEALAIRAEMVANHIEADLVVFPSAKFKNEIGDDNRIWNLLSSRKSDLERFFSFDPPWCISGPVWKRESFINLGGFKEAALNGQDWEIHVRAIMGNLMIVKAPDSPENFHNYIRNRGDENSISNTRPRPDLVENRVFVTESLRPAMFRIPGGKRYLFTLYFMEHRIIVKRNNKDGLRLFRRLRKSFPFHYQLWWLFNDAWIKLAEIELNLLGGLPVPKMINRIYNWKAINKIWIGKVERHFWTTIQK